MKKIFIDGGANTGSSVKLFRSKFPQGAEYEIYSFEPNPSMHQRFKDLKVHFLPYAIWIYDGTIDFYIGRNPTSMSSSVFKNKKTGNLKKEPMSVPCIDFSKWLTEHFQGNHHLVLKLDIEGAEYDVLEHLLRQGTIRLVNELYIDWHHEKIGVSQERHNALIHALRQRNLPPKTWSTESMSFGENAV